MPSAAESYYTLRRDECAAAARVFTRHDGWLTHLRLLVFLLSVGLAVVGWTREQKHWYVGAGGVFLALLGLAAYHELILTELKRRNTLKQINEWALARLKRDWSRLPEPAVEVPAIHRATSDDLDLFGHASLFQFLCRAYTPLGKAVLRDWLLEPSDSSSIQSRQHAVRELAGQRELRESLALEGCLLPDRGHATDRFLEWAEGPGWLAARSWLLWLARLSPLVIVAVGAVAWLGIVEPLTATGILLAAVAFNFLLSVLFAGRIHDIFMVVGVRSGAVRPYLKMFELMYELKESDSELGRIRQAASQLGGGVLPRMRALRWLAMLAAIQHSALLFIFVYLPLQFLFLYDFHVLYALEIWQRRSGRFARGWFTALGQFESLCSLAGLHHDYPEWSFGHVDESADRLTAEQLGHPLIADHQRVPNDVEIGPDGSFLLVTGSNMSGKSTLLRSVGSNAVLAQAGAPVCARRLLLPPVVLGTSMRVRDSLETGVSFYMAELMRLKEIVDLAADPERRKGRRLLYLLDEILLGTNSRERHIAIVRVMEFLLSRPTIGAISTHDLELATTEPLNQVCRCVHFRETLHGSGAERPMTFDYQMREGVATTTNALKLLELVGLPAGRPQ